MKFDGAKSQSGMGAGIVLTSPCDDNHCFSFHLEFEGTNNVVEYEALFLGLELAKYYGIELLDIVGNSNSIVVVQVKGNFACENQRLKRQEDAMQLTTKNFNASFI